MIVKEKSFYKQMFSFSMWDLIGAFCSMGNSQGIAMLINYFFGLIYNAAQFYTSQVEGAIIQFTNGFMTAVRPQIVKLYAVGKIDKMLSLVFNSSKYSFFLLYIIALPVFLETEYIIKIWLKTVPDYSVLFLRCIILIRMIRAFAIPVVQAVHATGNIKWLNLYALVTSIPFTLPSIYILYRLGYPAEFAFYVIGLLSFVANYLELYCLKKEIKFSIMKYAIRIYGTGILIILLSAIPIYYLRQSLEMSFLRLFLVCAADVLLVGSLVFFIGISFEDRQKLITTFKEKIMHYVKL